MNYYPFNIGDYVAHTAHLTVIEDCAYRRLIDLYYMTEQALPSDVKACARLIRMREYEQVFDQNYGTVKAYHADVWREAYALSINPVGVA